MGHICSTPHHRIPTVCSAASIQEELVEHSGQCNSIITGSCITVDTLQFRDAKKVDRADRAHCSTTTDVFCYVCSMQAPFMVHTSEMSTKVKKHLQKKNFRQQELCDEEQIPDRIVNPCEYQQLSQNIDSDENSSETDNLPTIGAYTNDYGSIQQ